jgi:hypothetical protein
VPGGDEVATVISAHEYEAGESSGSGRLDRKIERVFVYPDEIGQPPNEPVR